jgi:hypothetical protein
MNVQTGTATSFDALLDNICAFLVTNGWTQNAKTSAGENTGQKAHLQKTGTHGTIYVNFKSHIKDTTTNIFNGATGVLAVYYDLIDGIAMNLSTGYSAGESRWNYQPGVYQSGNQTSYPHNGVAIQGEGNIPTYWIFQQSSPEFVCIFVEFALGFYTAMMFGELDKTGAGSYTGGQFFAGCQNYYAPVSYYGGVSPYAGYPDPDSIYRLVQNPFTYYDRFTNLNNITNLIHSFGCQLNPSLHGGRNGWLGPVNNGTSFCTYQGPGDWAGVVTSAGVGNVATYEGQPSYNIVLEGSSFRRSANAANLVTELLPVHFFWQRSLNNQDTSSPELTFLGTIPNLYLINMRDLQPKQTFTYGTDDFIALPFNQKISPFQYDITVVNSKYLRVYGSGAAIKTN